jgi:hypothetical protein
LAFFLIFFSLTMYRHLGMAYTLAVGGAFLSLATVCAARSIDVGVWYFEIPAMVLAVLMIVGVWVFYGQTEDEAKRISTNWHGAMKVLFTVFLLTFVIFYIIDTPWTNAVKGDLVLMACIDLVRDVLGFGVWGLIMLIWLDYYENMSGIGAIFTTPSKGFPRFDPINRSGCDASTPLAPGASPTGGLPATRAGSNNMNAYPFGLAQP